MERSQIEGLFDNGQYQQALNGLNAAVVSPWRDTTKLRCMRAMGHKKCLDYADQLRVMITERSATYSLTTPQRNNLLRYIALVYSERNRAPDACEIIENLCRQNPDIPALHREYAFALTNNSQLDEAEAELNRAIELQPSNANSHAQLGRIYCLTGRTKAGYSSYSRAATLEPNNTKYLQRLLYWSNYLVRTTQQSNYQLSKLWANKAASEHQPSAHARQTIDPGRQLNIAFISSDFSDASISSFVVPLLEGINRTEFQVIVYNDSKKSDQLTASIRDRCDRWHDCENMNDSQLNQHLVIGKTDILVDLSGHKKGNRLSVFAKQVAPIQLSWLGYPSTTGLKSIGYRITDRVADPSGLHDQFFSEKLLRLPSGFLCYKPLETAPEIKANGGHDHIRFGAFNDLSKASSVTLDCWAAALLAVPRSTIYIKDEKLVNQNATDYFLNQLAERGILDNRIILDSSKTNNEQYLEAFNSIDIALDTTPYNGTITTLDALWMGVPVISLTGQTHASRRTASILHRLNLGGLATKTVPEFAERARELSELSETLLELRFSLRKRMKGSSLMNKRQFAREFGNTLRSQWRDLCQEHNSQTDTLAHTERPNIDDSTAEAKE